MNWVRIGSDNGLSPIRCQAIIWTNAWLFSIWPLGANFSEILIKLQHFSFTIPHLKMFSAKWLPFCPEGDDLLVHRNNWPFESASYHSLCEINATVLKILFVQWYVNYASLFWIWITHYIHTKLCNVITHPCHNFSGFAKLSLQFGYGWVINPYIDYWMSLHFPALNSFRVYL